MCKSPWYAQSVLRRTSPTDPYPPRFEEGKSPVIILFPLFRLGGGPRLLSPLKLLKSLHQWTGSQEWIAMIMIRLWANLCHILMVGVQVTPEPAGVSTGAGQLLLTGIAPGFFTGKPFKKLPHKTPIFSWCLHRENQSLTDANLIDIPLLSLFSPITQNIMQG